jgi:predicted MFS family arabinose efflux permease
VLQGAGAISAAVMAAAADLTREQHRTKAMAMIGSTIGLAFAVSLVASPWLDRHIGVPGIFAMTGVLAMAAMIVVWRIVPNATDASGTPPVSGLRELWKVALDPQLVRWNYGIFALHAILMSLFIAIPFTMRDAGLPLSEHWKVYLPVMLGSFVLMVPAIMGQGRSGRVKRTFVFCVAVILAAHLALPWLASGVAALALFLLIFFAPFNILEALLPSLTSRMAPAGSKGVAIGVYSSVQFLGTFVGAAAGGYLYSRWALNGIVIGNAALAVIWLMIAAGMRIPEPLSTRSYSVPPMDFAETQALVAALRAMPGVHEARVDASESTAYLKVDSVRFDEHNVLQAIAGKGELGWRP